VLDISHVLIISVHLKIMYEYLCNHMPPPPYRLTHHQQQINMNLNNAPHNLITVFGL